MIDKYYSFLFDLTNNNNYYKILSVKVDFYARKLDVYNMVSQNNLYADV